MELSSSVMQQLRNIDQVVTHSQQVVSLAPGLDGIRVGVLDDPSAVPDRIDGVPIAVEVVGRNEFQRTAPQLGVDPRQKTRPLIAGISISDAMTGTLGYFVRIDNHVCVISSAHILPNVGGTTIQPGSADGGTGTDRIASVVASIDNLAEGVEAAAARLDRGVEFEPKLNELGKVTGITTATPQQTVRKSGRTTGVTTAQVQEVGVAVKTSKGWFQHQIAISSFSANGDSGSLVVTEDNRAVGMIMAGNDVYSYANPIDRVLAQLNATLAL